MLSTRGQGFTASHVVRSGHKATPRSVTRPVMAQQQQQSSALELVDDAAILPGIAASVFEKDARPVLLYDGVCNMCNGFVNLFLDVDTDEKFRFSALQSQTGRALLALSGRSPDDISSIVLVEQSGAAHIQSDALLRMGRLLGGPVGLVLLPGVLVPKFVRNKMYDTVADNRYSVMGKRDVCRCSDERYADRFI
ncbi:conserved unknown protein [Ectocarpus siliculosus]|uniref:Thiol-disulphide oxidoreductase DCC n=1 Tax=Ectocarpus siliculosus TaxID=2880 RepID=D7FVA6_ECTSI|nr:conserved unknown protein [Ectocarpus siliculosus]|eukprot:CBJ26278.1 conserved unknown protein [Ectocarpus siliculosus]